MIWWDRPELQRFHQALQELGWIEGKNLKLDYRWRGDSITSSIAELVKLEPDLIYMPPELGEFIQ
jgi:hypothetical protein